MGPPPDHDEDQNDGLVVTSSDRNGGSGITPNEAPAPAQAPAQAPARSKLVVVVGSDRRRNWDDSSFGTENPELRRTPCSGFVQHHFLDRDGDDGEGVVVAREASSVPSLTSIGRISRGATGFEAVHGEEADERRRKARRHPALIAHRPPSDVANEEHVNSERELRVLQSRFIFVPASIGDSDGPARMLFRTYHVWHNSLRLESSLTPVVACAVLQRRLAVIPSSMRSMQRARQIWRRLMAASFWVAAKLCETTGRVPPASLMASVANVPQAELVDSELSLLVAVKWRPVPLAWIDLIHGGAHQRLDNYLQMYYFKLSCTAA